MKFETDFPDHLLPLIERLRSTGLYVGDDGTIVYQLAIRSLRDMFEKPLIAESYELRAPQPQVAEQSGRGFVADVEAAHEIMSKLDAEEEEAGLESYDEAAGDEPPHLEPISPKQYQALVALREMAAEGIGFTVARLLERGGPSAYVSLPLLEKKGYVRNDGERGAPDWKVLFHGEPEIVTGHWKQREPVETKPAGRKAPFRRFPETRPLDPESVSGLPAAHPAVVEKRTLFPNRVIDPSEAKRLLVSGGNSRKIGDRVTKGVWDGMPIFTLTLEERASCPKSCYLFRECYGNAMQWPNRHRHGQELIDYLRAELVDLQDEHPDGFVVRLHVLGDFWSVDYVAAWAGFLRTFPALHVFGYTAHERGSEIGAAIKRLTDTQWDRFAVRFSSQESKPQGATTIFRLPEADTVAEGIVCPAQLGTTDCCGTCGLCWAEPARDKTIVFVAHGKVGGGRARKEPFLQDELAAQHALAFKPTAPSEDVEDPEDAEDDAIEADETPARPTTITRVARIAQQAAAMPLPSRKPVPSPVLSRREPTDADERYRATGPVAPVGTNIRAEMGAWLRSVGVTCKVHPGDRFEARGRIMSFTELVEFTNDLRAEDGLDPFHLEENA